MQTGGGAEIAYPAHQDQVRQPANSNEQPIASPAYKGATPQISVMKKVK